MASNVFAWARSSPTGCVVTWFFLPVVVSALAEFVHFKYGQLTSKEDKGAQWVCSG